MTEVKLYRGLKAELPSVITDGAIYVTTDTGEVFVDVSDTDRVQLNSAYAAGLRAADGTILAINDIFTVAQAEALERKSFATTLLVDNWIQVDDVDTGETYYSYQYNNTELTCGTDGTIPPQITYTSNVEEYSKLDPEKTIATPGVGITFITSTLPTADIGLIIIDK